MYIYIYVQPPRRQYYVTLVYKRYILPIGWWYTTYHSLQEPEKNPEKTYPPLPSPFEDANVLFPRVRWHVWKTWRVDLKSWDSLDHLDSFPLGVGGWVPKMQEEGKQTCNFQAWKWGVAFGSHFSTFFQGRVEVHKDTFDMFLLTFYWTWSVL